MYTADAADESPQGYALLMDADTAAASAPSMGSGMALPLLSTALLVRACTDTPRSNNGIAFAAKGYRNVPATTGDKDGDGDGVTDGVMEMVGVTDGVRVEEGVAVGVEEVDEEPLADAE
jgi:hypothetical protein